MISFKQYETVFYYEPSEYKNSDSVVSFDLDWTLTYNEKHLYPKEVDDIYIFPKRKQMLEKLIEEGNIIVIFTNQFAKSKKEKLKKVERISTFMDKLNLPVFVYIATEKDNYRKPDVGMWNMFNKDRNIKKVTYVGDALGRPQDFSDSDKIFGENINAVIKSPEEFFGKEEKHCFNNEKELVVFVGMPGSGKSSYYHKNLNEHIHIEQDKIGTRPKVLKELDKAFLTGKSIVIDSTNPSQEKRSEYYEKAKKHKYNIKVIYFLVNGTGFNKLREKPVPDIVYHIYFKNLEAPTAENTEGEILYVV